MSEGGAPSSFSVSEARGLKGLRDFRFLYYTLFHGMR